MALGAGIVRDHHDGFVEAPIQLAQQSEDILGRSRIEVSRKSTAKLGEFLEARFSQAF